MNEVNVNCRSSFMCFVTLAYVAFRSPSVPFRLFYSVFDLADIARAPWSGNQQSKMIRYVAQSVVAWLLSV